MLFLAARGGHQYIKPFPGGEVVFGRSGRISPPLPPPLRPRMTVGLPDKPSRLWNGFWFCTFANQSFVFWMGSEALQNSFAQSSQNRCAGLWQIEIRKLVGPILLVTQGSFAGCFWASFLVNPQIECENYQVLLDSLYVPFSSSQVGKKRGESAPYFFTVCGAIS